MVSRIEKRFKELKKDGRKALIPYIMVGDPDLTTTEELVIEIERAGADMIELGVPFNDPLADGPAIQKAGERGLKNKVSLRDVFAIVKRLREKTEIPLIIMTYYNLIFRYGEDAFARDAVGSGIDGVIIPDLPPEEGDNFIKASRLSGLDTIFLTAPTSTEERINKIAKVSRGFIYHVSLTGVTGSRLGTVESIRESVDIVRRYSRLPVAVGFGVSSPEQASVVTEFADGVIVGSAVVRIIENNFSSPTTLKTEVYRFIASLRKGIDEF
ncbi:MAG: tryptophan synthase subunit alpha [Nitrospirota bacterium]